MTDSAAEMVARLAIEEHEAALCPEDYGCKEYIALLIKQRDQARACVVGLIEALREISEGRGRFSLDHHQHAKNTIEDMKEIAVKALRTFEQAAGAPM